MTETPAVLELHAVRHPEGLVRQVGFPLDHPFLERCWAPLIGPSSVMLLRRCSRLWQVASPARIPTEELSRQLGLGRGAGPSSSTRSASQATSPAGALPPHLRMAARLERLGQTPSPSSSPPSR
ncbi:MAG TPA: hypothetical protein VNF50_04155 [Acidimicrobiales bacterium]|nr:hypothetical protein [Acidimicrobiales bacterium]